MGIKTQTKQEALLDWLKENDYPESTIDDIDEGYSESNFEAHGNEYLVLTDDEANEATKEYIEQSVWVFNASFIIGECELDFSGQESLEKMQGEACEGANNFILSLIEKTCGLDEFVNSAISADGRGHFLSSYDGKEHEQGIYFIYQTN